MKAPCLTVRVRKGGREEKKMMYVKNITNANELYFGSEWQFGGKILQRRRDQ